MTRTLGLVACCVILLLTAAGAAKAGSFQVNPVRVTLSANQPIGSLTVSNTGTEAAVVQLELVSWSQHEGRDVYTPARDLLATPPIFTVPAGGSQVVRIGLRRLPDDQRELTYRLFLQEVPAPVTPAFQGLQVALRIGVPVFVLPAVETKPAVAWRAIRTRDGQLKLMATNQGSAHVQVAQYTLSFDQSTERHTQQVATYVLMGESRNWLIQGGPSQGSALHLFAQTDAGDISVDLLVEDQ